MNKKIEDIKKISVSKPLKLDCGKIVNSFPLAYETYGKLNENKNNAILVFHALTGDQFVTETNPVTNKEGWWVTAVGPGKAIDTNKYFVICANVIGGCMGSWGPSDKNQETNLPKPGQDHAKSTNSRKIMLNHAAIKLTSRQNKCTKLRKSRHPPYTYFSC